MGDSGSNRWEWQRTRQAIDSLLWLDIRRLHKIGGLEPGAVCTQAWSRRGEQAGDIATIMDSDGQAVTLAYQTRRSVEEWQPVREPIDLDWTPCNFDSERPWFRCPGCYQRRAVLYSVNGQFRCRGCHDLAYSSTRENELDRAVRRADKLRVRLGDTSRGAVWRAPTGLKPAGMSWKTYWGLRQELERENDRMHGHFVTQFDLIDQRIAKLLERREMEN